MINRRTFWSPLIRRVRYCLVYSSGSELLAYSLLLTPGYCRRCRWLLLLLPLLAANRQNIDAVVFVEGAITTGRLFTERLPSELCGSQDKLRVVLATLKVNPVGGKPDQLLLTDTVLIIIGEDVTLDVADHESILLLREHVE